MIINYTFLWLGLLGTAFALLFINAYLNRARIKIVDMHKLWMGMIFFSLMGLIFIFLAFFDALLAKS